MNLGTTSGFNASGVDKPYRRQASQLTLSMLQPPSTTQKTQNENPSLPNGNGRAGGSGFQGRWSWLLGSSVFAARVPFVSADAGEDFSNNLASDLAPLLSLFGEQVAKQVRAWVYVSCPYLHLLIVVFSL